MTFPLKGRLATTLRLKFAGMSVGDITLSSATSCLFFAIVIVFLILCLTILGTCKPTGVFENTLNVAVGRKLKADTFEISLGIGEINVIANCTRIGKDMNVLGFFMMVNKVR